MSESPGPNQPPRTGNTPERYRGLLWPALATAAVLTAAVIELRRQGRLWWCACGQWALWWGDTNSSHNSQHPFDPYSFTHVQHGIVYCGVLALAARRLAPAWRLCLAITFAAIWEVFENTDFVIDRYRSTTASLGYQGDTIVNSLGDITSCVIGYAIARRIGPWWSLALFVAIEVVLLFWIRDSLLLNIVMLVHPIPSIKAWQTGG
jgi:hypothetical protein